MPTTLDLPSGTLQSDLVWRNQASGVNLAWQLDGTKFAFHSSAPQAGSDIIPLLTVADPTWEIKGNGDFNGDKLSDIVWRNRLTGDNLVWYLNGSQFAKNPTAPQIGQDFDFLPGLVDRNWDIQAIGDFNQDGSSDLVWRNQITGENTVWYLRNHQFLTNSANPQLGQDFNYFLRINDPNWQIKGSADFNNDGFSDLVWRHQATGQNLVWFLKNTQFASNPATPKAGQDYEFLLTIADPNWQIATIGHFNRDNRPDIVWQNLTTGQRLVWLLNGTQFATNPAAPKAGQDYEFLLTIADRNWQIVGALHHTASNNTAGTTLASAIELDVISGLKTVQASISSNAPNDYYRFSVTTPQSINVLLHNLTANADLQLLDASGQAILDPFQRPSPVNTDNTAEVRSRVLNAGTYYIQIYGSNIDTTYQLSILGLAPTTNVADRVVELTNFYRTQSGVANLQLNQSLTTAAQGHSQAMALTDFFDHTGLDGSTPTQRAQNAGYRGSSGENIAAGQINAEQAMEGWMYSPGHRDNILSTRYQDIGIGYYYREIDPGTQSWRYYWTAAFGLRG
jgi:uncharacterized protein YkwD